MNKTIEIKESIANKGMRVMLFVFLIAQSMVLVARPVSPELARRVAANWMGRDAKVGSEDVRIVYTHTNVKTGIEAFYAVNVGNHAFVLVAADDVARPVLGYSTTREFIVENIPAHVLWYYDELASQIGEAVTNGVAQDHETAKMWRQLSFGDAARYENPDESPYTSLADSVGPLLSTRWNQGLYYNDLCPVDSLGPNGHVFTGCVATAMAQIVKYWEYPLHGRGMFSYYHGWHNMLYNYGVLSVNYENTTYDYSLMPSDLYDSSTPQEITAVATLMRDCGVAAYTLYGPYGSSSSDEFARIGLVNHFRYSPEQKIIRKNDFTCIEWDSILRADINEGQPILYIGYDSINQSGHAFVCDGYKQEGYFHFNFGWSGWCDGWYLSSVVNPSQHQYNSNQRAIISIVPDSTSNVIFASLSSSYSMYTVEQPIEFRGYTAFMNFDTISFIPIEDTLQLVMDYVLCEEADWARHVYLYDGVGTSYLMDSIVGGTITYSPMATQSHAMTMVFNGYFNDDYLLISEYTDCRIVGDLTANVHLNTVHLQWLENGASTRWELEYGEKGFAHGEGTVLTVDNCFADIAGLTPYTTYDFYVRPACGGENTVPWKKITKNIYLDLPYWTDIVTSQPLGFEVDANGNISISTAEGLAWLSRIVNEMDGPETANFIISTVKLVSDIDLGRYQWYPLGATEEHPFSGTFNGNGYKIKNLLIGSDEFPYAGLFGFVNYGELRQCTIEGGMVIHPNGETGGLAGYVYVTNIMGCHADLQVTGSDYVGGLCGKIVNGDSRYWALTNCSSNCIVTGNTYVGGLGGYCQSQVRNSYARGTVVARDDGCCIGGLTGENSYCSIQNCYVANEMVLGHTCRHVGCLTGYSFCNNTTNAYAVNNDLDLTLIGALDNSSASDTARFYPDGWGCSLTTPIIIDNVEYDSLTAVLNAWADYNDNERLCWHWVADKTGVNGGFPSFFVVGGSFVNNYIASDEISVFPNPTSKAVTIAGENIEHIDVIDPHGRVVIKAKYGEGVSTCTIDFTALPPSIYFLRISTFQGQTTKILIKK